ncbi:MAG: KilA-N domain-containing protein, partial [Christensenellaceae bacterium]|nr:KilA-N domain-containing protein [Christensenellaceae bacterium]
LKSGENVFLLSPQKWIKMTNAVGIISKSGNGGGTYAHKDIAFKFASWLSVEFELYMIMEFERLKADEQKHLEWSAKRELAKINYHIHTDAIKENLIVPTLTASQKKFKYASEADLLNVALFGKTAGEWREQNLNKEGNIRDYASIQQLIVLSNMENYNAIMINDKLCQEMRLERLNETARQQLKILYKVENKLYLPNYTK